MVNNIRRYFGDYGKFLDSRDDVTTLFQAQAFMVCFEMLIQLRWCNGVRTAHTNQSAALEVDIEETMEVFQVGRENDVLPTTTGRERTLYISYQEKDSVCIQQGA